MADALHDPLTGLPSREVLREHARVALARARGTGREVALLHAGLDDFALVNGSLGHDAGDAILREVAERVRRAVPAQHVVARARGDELCILLADLPPDSAEEIDALGTRVLHALREPFAAGPGAQTFELGATLGASVFPNDAADDDGLLRHAEAALHQAKQAQRGGLLFYAGGTSEALHRLLITSRLRTALAAQDFFLEFQPIVGLPDGRVRAVESLLRWNDGERGRVPPLDFIPHAEESGLIVPIGEWVMRAACEQARAFAEEGFDLYVTFNASPRQFRDPGFVEALEATLHDVGIAAGRIVVEITETTAMGDRDAEILAGLGALGVRVAIDDFGVGSSSLGRLRELEVDLLKLDRSFVPDTPADERAARLMVATLGLAEALGMTAVVEGVETAEQYDFLLANGAPLMQGFHLARPMPAAQVADMLRG